MNAIENEYRQKLQALRITNTTKACVTDPDELEYRAEVRAKMAWIECVLRSFDDDPIKVADALDRAIGRTLKPPIGGNERVFTKTVEKLNRAFRKSAAKGKHHNP